MENFMNELSQAAVELKESLIEKTNDPDEKTLKNMELIKRVRMEVSVFAEILLMRFGGCNAKLACSIADGSPQTFEIMLLGGEVLVHCPEWNDEKGVGWRFLDEIILSDAREIAKSLIEIRSRKENITMELL